jgi:single-strand DNA-binding protein
MQGVNVTVVGNLTDDPDYKVLPNDSRVCNFKIAVTNRIKKGDGEFVDGPPVFFRCAAWADMAENVRDSLSKGDQVLVLGKLVVRTWQGDDGVERSSLDLSVDEVAANLRFATARPEKARRGGVAAGAPATPRARGDFNDPPPF